MMISTSDSGPCVSVFRAHSALAARRKKSRERLADVRAAFKKCDTIKDSRLAIFCAGSLARMEAGARSDLDLFVDTGAGARLQIVHAADRAAKLSAFLYDALTHETIQRDLRRALLL